MSATALENRVYGRKGQEVSVRLAMLMQEASQTAKFAEAVAMASGGVFIPMLQFQDIENRDIHEEYMRLIDRVGALARTFRECTEDNSIDRQERRTLENIGQEICTLVTQINAITFNVYCK